MLYTWYSTVFESVWIFQYLQCMFIIDINSTCLHTNHRTSKEHLESPSNISFTSTHLGRSSRRTNLLQPLPVLVLQNSHPLKAFLNIFDMFLYALVFRLWKWTFQNLWDAFSVGDSHLVQSIEDSSIPCLWLCTTTNDAKASSIYWVCSGQKKIEQVRNIARLYVIVIETSVSVASPWVPVLRTKPMVELLISLESLRLAMSTTRSSDLQALYPWSTDVYINFVCLRIIIITSYCVPFRSWNRSLC